MGLDAVMHAVVPRVLTEEEVKRTAVHAQIVLGHRALWVNSSGTYSPREHSLTLSDVSNGTSRVRVNTMARYYGPGYERGPLIDLLAVAGFLRHTWTGCEVFYGHDQGGDIELLTVERERELLEHFYGKHGRAYFDFSRDDDKRPTCEFCDIQMIANMNGGGQRGYYCPSCHDHWLVRDGAAPVQTQADYKTPVDPTWKQRAPQVQVPVMRLKALLDTLRTGDPAQHALADLEILLDELEVL